MQQVRILHDGGTSLAGAVGLVVDEWGAMVSVWFDGPVLAFWINEVEYV